MSKELDKLIEQVLSEKNTFSVDVTNRLSPSDPSEEEEDETPQASNTASTVVVE